MPYLLKGTRGLCNCLLFCFFYSQLVLLIRWFVFTLRASRSFAVRYTTWAFWVFVNEIVQHTAWNILIYTKWHIMWERKHLNEQRGEQEMVVERRKKGGWEQGEQRRKEHLTHTHTHTHTHTISRMWRSLISSDPIIVSLCLLVLRRYPFLPFYKLRAAETAECLQKYK